MYHQMGIDSGAIIRELATPLAMYETKVFEFDGEVHENLFDVISGKEVEMPQHLKDLSSIIVE